MEKVTLRKPRDAMPWGFRVLGGAEYQERLYVKKVTPGGLADRFLEEGDLIISINGKEAYCLSLKQAQSIIQNSGQEIQLTIIRPSLLDQRDDIRGGRMASMRNNSQFTSSGSVPDKILGSMGNEPDKRPFSYLPAGNEELVRKQNQHRVAPKTLPKPSYQAPMVPPTSEIPQQFLSAAVPTKTAIWHPNGSSQQPAPNTIVNQPNPGRGALYINTTQSHPANSQSVLSPPVMAKPAPDWKQSGPRMPSPSPVGSMSPPSYAPTIQAKPAEAASRDRGQMLFYAGSAIHPAYAPVSPISKNISYGAPPPGQVGVNYGGQGNDVAAYILQPDGSIAQIKWSDKPLSEAVRQSAVLQALQEDQKDGRQEHKRPGTASKQGLSFKVLQWLTGTDEDDLSEDMSSMSVNSRPSEPDEMVFRGVRREDSIPSRSFQRLQQFGDPTHAGHQVDGQPFGSIPPSPTNKTDTAPEEVESAADTQTTPRQPRRSLRIIKRQGSRDSMQSGYSDSGRGPGSVTSQTSQRQRQPSPATKLNAYTDL